MDPLLSQTGQPYSYAADDPVNQSDPTGQFTLGICGGGSASALISIYHFGSGAAGSGSICAFADTTGFFGNITSISLSETLAYSLASFAQGLSFGINGFLGVQISTAASPHDLTGWFQQRSVDASIATDGVEGSVFWGRDSAGQMVYGAELGWAPGAEIGTLNWRSYTWVQTYDLGLGSSLAFTAAWHTAKAIVDIPDTMTQGIFLDLAKRDASQYGGVGLAGPCG